MKGMRTPLAIFMVSFLLTATGCQDDEPCPEGLSWCWARCVDLVSDENNCGRCDVVCGVNSYCMDGECECFPGYHEEAIGCVEDDDPCEGVTCSEHGSCALVDGEPLCICEPGYHSEGMTCVEDIDLCEGVDCSGHGQCAVADDEPVCICNLGYHAEGL